MSSLNPEKETIELVDEESTETITNDHIRNQSHVKNFWDALRKSIFWIKRFVHDQCSQYVFGDNSKSTRAYHVWPGNNLFFFHGRLICGPDPRGLILTTVSIVLSSWIFVIYIGSDLPNHSTLAISISLILTIIVLANLILVSSIDPGIIPRNDQASSENSGSIDGRRKKMVYINGIELRLKYCRICKIFRPPRSCHCAVCDNCVEKFDHHCPLIGQCVALRNYRFYLAFIASALVYFAYIFACSAWRIRQKLYKASSGLFGLLRNCPETLALVVLSFGAILFLGGLMIYHVYLIAINQTAYENFREHHTGSRNPYDKGIVSNFKEVLFVPMPPSKVDFRAEVEAGWFSEAAPKF